MATSEDRITNLEEKYSNLHTVVNVMANKVDNLVEEMRERDKQRAFEMQDFKQEMRQQNEMRASEIAELRDSIKEIYTTTDSKIDSIRQSIQTMQNQNVVVIIGVIAIAVAVFLK